MSRTCKACGNKYCTARNNFNPNYSSCWTPISKPMPSRAAIAKLVRDLQAFNDTLGLPVKILSDIEKIENQMKGKRK